MPIEISADKVVQVVKKEIFNPYIHTVNFAIKTNDIELLEFLFRQYDYTYTDFKDTLQDCIIFSNLTLLKCAIKHYIEKYRIEEIIDSLIKQAEFYRVNEITEYLRIIDESC